MNRIPELLREIERPAGKIGYYHDDEAERAVISFGEPIHSGYVLIRRDHLANVTSPEHERWKRTQPFLGATSWP